MPVSVPDLIKRIASCGLLSDEEIFQCRDSLAADLQDDAQALAKHLVRQKKLTPFQANMLLEERSGQLVIGDYIVMAQLNEGQLGRVYRAQNASDEGYVVLRVLPPPLRS